MVPPNQPYFVNVQQRKEEAELADAQSKDLQIEMSS
jgi:hypothetical protein